MKKYLYILLGIIFHLSSCLTPSDDFEDLEPPKVKPLVGLEVIQPEFFLSVEPELNEIPLFFTLMDESGIQQIQIESHSGFDGHTHGRIALNKNFAFLSHWQVIDQESITNPLNFTSDKSNSLKIYLDDRNPELSDNSRILAGPYHFSIKATDILGNETSYADNSTYHTTIFIRRAYAPKIDIVQFDIENQEIVGTISRNMNNEFSSDITFLWIYIEEPSQNTGQEGEIINELIWGNSNWPHQFRANQGMPLPNGENLVLNDLLAEQDEFINQLNNNILTIWAEDANGNISVKRINN